MYTYVTFLRSDRGA